MLRLRPGLILATVLLLSWFGVPAINSAWYLYGLFGALGAGAAIALWWLFFSRAPWLDRLGAIALILVGLLVVSRFVHPSISNGMMGMMLPMYSIPLMGLALAVMALAASRFSGRLKRTVMAVVILTACGLWTMVRSGGMTGEAGSDFHWRWTPTPEERLLAKGPEEPAGPAPTPEAAPVIEETPAAATSTVPSASPSPSPSPKISILWPGFRGSARNGVVRGTKILTDWAATPPLELWRREIGPGWSSFAVKGDLLYTQEQRGEAELVACYDITSGKLVWKHVTSARFWESNAGAGPRGTPTVSSGRVFALGATGILKALDAGNGSVIWTRNIAADSETKVPEWGFAASPLILGNTVIVAAAGRLIGYDISSGKPRWLGPAGKSGYSSPQLMTIEGTQQVLLLSSNGVAGFSPADGKLLWEHKWIGDGIVQPAITTDGDILIGTGSGLGSGAGLGVRRISVRKSADGWNAEERWTSNGLKPYYNDFVIHQGYAFGFDGSILSCIDLSDGKRKWKGGRYGHGQMLLLADQNLLLILSEEGEIALVKASSDQFTELARFKALEGKTWNHPVLVGGLLLARNGEQMAAFRLPQ